MSDRVCPQAAGVWYQECNQEVVFLGGKVDEPVAFCPLADGSIYSPTKTSPETRCGTNCK